LLLPPTAAAAAVYQSHCIFLQDRAAALLQLQQSKPRQPGLLPHEKEQLLATARQREQQAAAEVEEREAAFRALGDDGWSAWFEVSEVCI